MRLKEKRSAEESQETRSRTRRGGRRDRDKTEAKREGTWRSEIDKMSKAESETSKNEDVGDNETKKGDEDE